MRPDLAIVPIRGNVNTRLRKLDAGEVDALVLALCGLERLGKAGRATEILPRRSHAAGGRAGRPGGRMPGRRRRRCVGLLAPLHDPVSAACVAAERAMLAALDGSAARRSPGSRRSPAIAWPRRLLLSPDGSAERRGRGAGAVADAAAIGAALGERLRRGAGPEFGFG